MDIYKNGIITYLPLNRVQIREKMSIRKKIRKFCGEACLPQVSNYTAENVNKCYFPTSDFLFTWHV